MNNHGIKYHINIGIEIIKTFKNHNDPIMQLIIMCSIALVILYVQLCVNSVHIVCINFSPCYGGLTIHITADPRGS